ncbi:NADH-quinone oxidoreductase subunit K [Falsarthrobacter nasiphocae]|uniref:Multicomponent Na+:H+ antiporter subunit C n=1 Tax=Falsarthrobacter nasiphocae TaxID=189863 RepID=A0AAE3YHT1_9MICC|nr:NADH-quinone oxidoreductase subunit K [Falsarthrobacter nasiphocae]MDR6892286.1 multicomponent Na+:H+ antiporter subunit C [Falsarthrobacter nasiphocae]
MSANLTLLVLMGVLYAAGVYLLLDKSLTRILLALTLITNATNLLLITTGGLAGIAPLVVKGADPSEYNDPLPQVFVLTSIVISFAITAFMLGIIYRTWVIRRRDEIERDEEDAVVAAKESYDAEEDADVVHEDTEFTKEHEG